VPSVPAGQEEAIGKTTVQHLQGVGDREAAQSLQSAQGLHTAPGVGPGHDAVALGRLAQGEFQTAFDRFKKGNKEFDRIEKYTGDEPVIHLNDYANAGADISQNKAATGIPPGAKAYGPDVKPLTEEEWSMEKFRKPYTNLSPTEKGHVDSLVRHASGVGGAGLVPFWVARRIQSKLGEVGWSGGAPIGSIGQGEARRLYVAISRDIDESFLTNRLDKFPNMPQELQNAKNAYKNGIQLFNRSIVRHLFPNRSDPTSPQKFVDALNHGNPTRLSYVMSHASPDLQEGIRGHILANWYKKATPFNQPFNFEESQFLKEVEPWYRDGRIDTLFPSGTQSRRQLDQLVTDFTQTASTPRAQKIDTIRRSLENQDPRFVHQYVLDPKHPQRTQQFFATADPATRQNLVRVWASDFQKDIQTALPYGRPGSPKVARPSKIYNTLSALEKTGQLDVMFQDFPGVADHLKKQIPLFEALQRAEKTATRQQQFGTWAALGQAAVGLHSLWNIAKGIATGSPGKIARGVGEGFAEVFPSAWTKAIHTEKGVRILSEGLNKVYGPAATGFAARILGAGGANTQSSPTQPPPAPQRAPTPSAPASSSPTAVKTPVKPPMSTEQRGALDSIFR
jgi:hypothetical protein